MTEKNLKKFLEFYCCEEYFEGKKYFSDEENIKDFFSALELIESSYEYNEAEEIFNQIISKSPKKEIFVCLCEIEKQKLNIDKYFYNSHLKRLTQSVESFYLHVKNAKEFISQNSFGLKENELLEQKIVDHLRFAKTLLMISSSYERRWDGDKNKTYKKCKNEILSNVDDFIAQDKQILGYDLKSHVGILDKFQALKNPQQLYIEQGNVCFNYYASVDMGLKSFSSSLLEKLDFFGVSFEEETLEDIWSGLKSKKQFAQKYSWNVSDKNSFKIKNFLEDGRDFEFEVVIYYYSLGIFNLSIKMDIGKDIQSLNMSDYRYILSLGTNFAMSEELYLGKQKFSFLKEFAIFVFNHINQKLCEFHKGYKDILYYEKYESNGEDKIELSSFTLCDLYEFSLGENKEKILHVKTLRENICFKALEINNREIRTGIDNWIFYTPECYNNLAPIRYSEDELIKVNRQNALIILPYQASWVRTQAVDSVQMAMAIRNLLSLNIKKYKQILYDKNTNAHILQNIKSNKDIKNISFYKNQIRLLLDLLDEGSVTQFYDHTNFMEAIFKELNISKIYTQALNVLEQFQEYSKSIFEEKKNKKFRWIFALVSSFLAASALKDFFEIVNYGDIAHLQTKGFLISPLLQLSCIFFISIFLIINQKDNR